MLTVALFGVMLVLFIANVPIPISLGLAATAALLTLPNVTLEVIVQRMFFGLDSFVILSVPLFLLLGELMEQSKITQRLVEFANVFVGRFRGGLGHVSVLTEMVLSGVSGSGTADAAATGVVLIPTMTRSGYGAAFSTALVGAAATLGPIIPPSIIMIIYASIANVSIARMFIGGIVPGVLAGISLMVVTAIIARRRNIPAGAPASTREMVAATRRASVVLIMPLIVLGGILGGVFTATESAAIGCLYALLLGIVVYRSIKLRELAATVRRAALGTGKVMFILATASAFSWILARGGVPEQIGHLPFFSATASVWVVLLSLNILLLILGCLMESIAILLIITPMILPIALRAGIDPVHLGVVMSYNLSLGLVTPPFGSVMFVVCGIGKTSIVDFARELLPFLTILVVVLGVITYIPGSVTWLPDLIMGVD
jgi:tripartite ATP-independent transporter DctM subunit